MMLKMRKGNSGAAGGGRGQCRGGGMGQGQGQNQGQARGQGRGQGRARQGGMAAGLGGECVCPKCGHTQPHERGIPCIQVMCPACGAAMNRA